MPFNLFHLILCHFSDVTNGFQQPPSSQSTSQCDANRFPPIVAPFNPPHTGVLPTTWHNFESDLDAPDISNWMPHQISNYFAQHGFGNEVCKVFIEQVASRFKYLLKIICFNSINQTREYCYTIIQCKQMLYYQYEIQHEI